MDLNIWILLDQRPNHNEEHGYILCSDCGNKFVRKSGFPLWKSSRQFGWRTVSLSWVRKFLEREWQGNLERTAKFIRELQAIILRKRSRAPRMLPIGKQNAEEPATKKNKSVKTTKGKAKPFPLLDEVRKQTAISAELLDEVRKQTAISAELLEQLKRVNDTLRTLKTYTDITARGTNPLPMLIKQLIKVIQQSKE